MAKRVESPSSINTFFQCNRKYYYHYIEKLPTKASIHTVRGNIAHSVLEHFYTLDVSSFQNYEKDFKVAVQKLFLEQWGAYKEELFALQLPQKELEFYFEETLLMLLNWCHYYLKEFKEKFSGSIEETFTKMKPITEVEYSSDFLSVRGFIDAIRSEGEQVHIIDYKTNANSEIKDSILLQLGIYSLLYQEKHNKIPDKVGVFFLKDKLYLLPVDQQLLENARFAIEQIHAQTMTTEKIADYKKNITPLCKWRTGQCDFYSVCQPYR
ncbi:PD-(D/E)XK nuclease family protein [Candidatus Woesearchaeota archaeon]|nr:PD-(D/E)XK nuclease family protein [Candidatus Woesearchaeota archaeon]